MARAYAGNEWRFVESVDLDNNSLDSVDVNLEDGTTLRVNGNGLIEIYKDDRYVTEHDVGSLTRLL